MKFRIDQLELGGDADARGFPIINIDLTGSGIEPAWGSPPSDDMVAASKVDGTRLWLDLGDGSLWTADGEGRIKPLGGKKVGLEHVSVDGVPINELLAVGDDGVVFGSGVEVDPDDPGVVRGVYLPRTIAEDDTTTVPLRGELALQVDDVDNPTRFRLRAGDEVTPGGLPLGGFDWERCVVVADTGTDIDRGHAARAACVVAAEKNPEAGNPVRVVFPPGVYDLGSDGLVLDTPHVYLVALMPAKVVNAGREDMALEPTVLLTSTSDTGTLIQTAGNALISDIELKNDRTGSNPVSAAGYSAYFPDSGVEGVVLRRVKIEGAPDIVTTNSAWATRLDISYLQSLDHCWSFGGLSWGGAGAFGGLVSQSRVAGSSSVGGYGDVLESARFHRVSFGTGVFGNATVNSGAVFRDCEGLPFSDQGVIITSTLADGTLVLEGGA